MKEFVAVLRNENGHLYESFFVFTTILLLSLILFPSFLAYKTEAVNRSIEIETRCFENILTIIRDNKITGKQCPLSKKPYLISHVVDQEVLTCPAPENHEWIKTTFVKKEDGWELNGKEREVDLIGGHHALSVTSGKIDLAIRPEKMIIRAESNFIMRYLIAPLHSLGFWRRLILGFVVWAGIMFFGMYGASVNVVLFFYWTMILSGFAIMPFLLFVYNDTDGVYSQKIIEVSRKDLTITETNRNFLKKDQPETLSDIQAVLPGKDDNDILVLYGRERLRSKRIVLRVDKNEVLHPKAVLSQAIFPSQ